MERKVIKVKCQLKTDAKNGRILVLAGVSCAVLAVVPIKFVLMIASGLLIGTGILICSKYN